MSDAPEIDRAFGDRPDERLVERPEEGGVEGLVEEPFDLERYERVLSDVLLAADPGTAIANLAPHERAWFARFDVDGLRISALIVARLRFERLMHGSRVAGEWYDSDPRAFTAAFKRYHTSVAPVVTFPSEEARRFESWLTADGAPRSPA